MGIFTVDIKETLLGFNAQFKSNYGLVTLKNYKIGSRTSKNYEKFSLMMRRNANKQSLLIEHKYKSP